MKPTRRAFELPTLTGRTSFNQHSSASALLGTTYQHWVRHISIGYDISALGTTYQHWVRHISTGYNTYKHRVRHISAQGTKYQHCVMHHAIRLVAQFCPQSPSIFLFCVRHTALMVPKQTILAHDPTFGSGTIETAVKLAL